MSQSKERETEEGVRLLSNIRFLLMQNSVKPEHIPAFVEAINWLEKQIPAAPEQESKE